MMDKGCDTGRAICPHKPMCMWNCHFTAGLKGEARFENTVITQPELTREVRPRLAMPEDIDYVPDTWQAVGAFIFGTALAMIVVFFALMFFTGMWIWSLLI
jgi:hypothetical protein